MIKRTIKYLLKKVGWELQRTENCSRGTMAKGLRWVGLHDFSIKTVLDVGASDGCWTELCIKYLPEADYLLFEPQPTHSDSLDTFAQSCRQKITPIKKAVGASDGQTFFSASEKYGGALSSNSNGDHKIKVDVTTIDTVVSQTQAKGPFLLKLDTHGFEKGILEGATDTLEKANVLIIEAYNYEITNEAIMFWELCAFLDDKGFRPIDLVDVLHRPHDNTLWQMDLFFIKSDWDGFKHVSYK